MIMKCANCYDSVATMLADKLKVIETMTDEIQTLRAKVASAEVLAAALRTIWHNADMDRSTNKTVSDICKLAEEALSTYEKT